MKIQQAHFEYLQSKCEQTITANPVGWSQHKAQHSLDRYVWDVARAAGLTTWICDNLYSYLNDDHISTALRKILK